MGQGRDPKSHELYLLQVLNRIDASIQGISGTPGGGGGSYPENTIDATNSSTAVLGAGAVFTGAAVEITDFAAINVSVFSDVASATDGLEMQFSPDGTNWDHIHVYSVSANISYSYNQASEMKFFRIKYTNGGTAQSFFRLQVILKVENVMPSRYTVEQAVRGGQLADIVKGVIYGETTGGGGGYVAVKVNPSGALTVEADIQNSVLPTGASTSALQVTANTSLNDIDNNTISINNEVQALNTKLTAVTVTPNILRATASGTIAPAVYSFSVANVGAADGSILGATIKAGETFNFDAGGLNRTFATSTITYDGTGTELVIIYNS